MNRFISIKTRHSRLELDLLSALVPVGVGECVRPGQRHPPPAHRAVAVQVLAGGAQQTREHLALVIDIFKYNGWLLI